MERENRAASTSLPEDAATLTRAGLERALANCVALELLVRSASWLEPAEELGAALPPLAADLNRFGDAIGRRMAVLGLESPPCFADLDRMSAVPGGWRDSDWRRRRSALADLLLRVAQDCHTLIAVLRNAGEEASLCILAGLLARCEETAWALRRGRSSVDST